MIRRCERNARLCWPICTRKLASGRPANGNASGFALFLHQVETVLIEPRLVGFAMPCLQNAQGHKGLVSARFALVPRLLVKAEHANVCTVPTQASGPPTIRLADEARVVERTCNGHQRHACKAGAAMVFDHEA